MNVSHVDCCLLVVDASQAGEGELEISINDGEVPNQVEVVGSGRCVVYFTPEEPKIHIIDIRFNGNAVPGKLYDEILRDCFDRPEMNFV